MPGCRGLRWLLARAELLTWGLIEIRLVLIPLHLSLDSSVLSHHTLLLCVLCTEDVYTTDQLGRPKDVLGFRCPMIFI